MDLLIPKYASTTNIKSNLNKTILIHTKGSTRRLKASSYHLL